MKRLLLLSLAMCFGLMGFSQMATVSKQLLNKGVKTVYRAPIKEEINFNQPVNTTTRAYMVSPTETVIGTTFYDLWSNASLGNRLTQFPDGTMAAVWTMGMEATTFPDRGTGYNYYDGSTWGPAPVARIESLRTGFPAHAAFGPNGEINVAHSATDLIIEKRDTKGTGAWTESTFPAVAPIAPTWARVVTSGDNQDIIHMLYCSFNAYNGQTAAMIYSKSTDGGQNWDPLNTVLDGTGSEYYTEINAEEYIMASRGNTVAIVVGNAWKDLFLLKSNDNGETWDKTVIWEHPYPMFDWNVTITDTFFCVDNSTSVAIGPDNIVHVAFGLNRVLHDVVGTSYYLFPYVDGIGYWHEGMPTFSNNRDALAGPQYGYPNSEMVENVNYIGWSQDVNNNGVLDLLGQVMYYRELGLSTMPAITVDNEGRIFVAYASTTETYDNVDYNFKKIWVRAFDGGEWGPFYHATADIIHIFDESIYPVLAKNSTDAIDLIYQADGTPGTALDGDHDYQENRVIHSSIPKTDVLTGISKNNGEITSESVTQNYPNPFNGKTSITVNLLKNAELNLKVTNLVGQLVYTKDKGFVNAGTYVFELDGTNWPTGAYFYSVKAGNSTVTKKMIVK